MFHQPTPTVERTDAALSSGARRSPSARRPPKTMPKRYLLTSSVLALNVACATPHRQAAGVIPWPGQEAPRTASTISIVHRGRDLCSRSVTIKDIEYNFDTACSGNTVLYVQTLDKKFISPEGLTIGRTLREAVSVGGALCESSDCGVTLPSGWIARPQMGRATRGSTVQPCSEILDDEISYFDTEFIEPHTERRDAGRTPDQQVPQDPARPRPRPSRNAEPSRTPPP